MAGSLSTRRMSASPGAGAAAPHSSRSPRLSRAAPLPISPPASPAPTVPWNSKNRRSTPNTVTGTGAPPGPYATPESRSTGAESTKTRANPGSPARRAASPRSGCAEKGEDASTASAAAPSRAVKAARRLPRTESPTTSAPTSTATAVAVAAPSSACSRR